MKFPEILSITTESDCISRIDMRITPELEYFAGHFPGLPILPGVVQLHWAIVYGQQYTLAAGIFLGMENIKFLAVVQPGAQLCLSLNWQPQKQALLFEYTSEAKKYSSGAILLGSRQ